MTAIRPTRSEKVSIEHSRFDAVLARASTAFAAHGFDQVEFKRFQVANLVTLAIAGAIGPAGNHPTIDQRSKPLSDPISALALSTAKPVDWLELLQSSAPRDQIRDYLAFLADVGIHDGLTIPVLGPDHICDAWTLSRSISTGQRITHQQLSEICGTAYLASIEIRRFQETKALPTQGAAQHLLSKREIEVLELCKEGKTYSEIASVIGISSKTVDYHMANSMRKLGVNQRLTAIIAALKLGLIQL